MTTVKTENKTNKTATKANKTATKTTNKTEVKEDKKQSSYTTTLKYSPIEKGKPQKVKPINPNTKSGKITLACQAIVSHFFVNKKQTEIAPASVYSLIDKISQELTGKPLNLFEKYKGHFPDCPIHQCMHRLSKTETKQIAKSKEGIITDSFALGQRAYMFKTDKVSPVKNAGFYLVNPKTEYKAIPYKDLQEHIKTIIEQLA
jgi:hypothetical protein